MSVGYTVLIGLLGCAARLLGVVHLGWPNRVERIWRWLENPKMPRFCDLFLLKRSPPGSLAYCR